MTIGGERIRYRSLDLTFQNEWLIRLTNKVYAVGIKRYTHTATGQLLTEDGPFTSDTVTNTYGYGTVSTWIRFKSSTPSWSRAALL